MVGAAVGSAALMTIIATVLFMRSKKNENEGIDENFVA